MLRRRRSRSRSRSIPEREKYLDHVIAVWRSSSFQKEHGKNDEKIQKIINKIKKEGQEGEELLKKTEEWRNDKINDKKKNFEDECSEEIAMTVTSEKRRRSI